MNTHESMVFLARASFVGIALALGCPIDLLDKVWVALASVRTPDSCVETAEQVRDAIQKVMADES